MVANNEIIIGDVEKFSIVDFPNQISAVVFLQGCPWRCPFCYNKSLQQIGGKPESDWTLEKLLFFLEKRKNVLDSVVFSGGEPLVHRGLKSAILAVKALGYKIGLHTGGYHPEHLKNIVSEIDWAGLDIKAPLTAEKYKAATGGYGFVDNIKESLNILLKSGIHFECRTTCDPRILTIDDIYQIADTLCESGVKEYYLQKYRSVPDDTETTEAMCAALAEDKTLTEYLHRRFCIFEVRK